MMSNGAREFASAMLDGINAFYTEDRPQNIKLIHIVVFQPGMVKDFKTIIQHKAHGAQPGIWAKFTGSALMMYNIYIYTWRH